MFGIGFQELVLLSLIGLIVLGPERLPRVANQIGGWLGQARRMTRVMKRQLEDELNFEKDLNIKPPDREPSTQPAPPPPGDDDHYSAEHAAGEVGTGVGDDDSDHDSDHDSDDNRSDDSDDNSDNDQYEADDDLAVTTADRREVEAPTETSAETPATSSDADVTEEPVTKEPS
jgi:sec-independent protein translocase protein TatB